MGLYDDDNAALTTGDVLDVIYWQTKFAALKLEAALKSRQPESAIRGLIPSLVYGCAEVMRDYPNHTEVRTWRDEAIGVEKKISPDAPPAGFKSDFAYWQDYSYESAWRFYHLAKMSEKMESMTMARAYATDAAKQLGFASSKMSEWPAEVQEWVRSAKTEMQGMQG